jgi:sugar (pentulose or hexulose) kinase
VGLDVGTSSVKAAAWRADGHRTAALRLPLPPLERWRGFEVQDPRALLRVAREALGALADRPPVPGALPSRRVVALTTQRDTLLLVDPDDRPLTPLLSWRERSHLEDPEMRARLLGPDGPATGVPTSLERWLARALARELGGDEVVLAGGDKNCEYLALGATPEHPGVGVVSLGSAITLGVGVAASEPPRPVPGVVISPAAGASGSPPAWNVETGILSGMEGLRRTASWLGVADWTGPLPDPARTRHDPRLRVVPHFGGALDDLSSRPRLLLDLPEGPFERAPGDLANPSDTPLTPATIALAWARGVAAELARLRPRLESVSGTPLRLLRIGGGGLGGEEGAPRWRHFLEEALALPVEADPDPWSGCRGAVLAVGGRADPHLTKPEAGSASETSPPGTG